MQIGTGGRRAKGMKRSSLGSGGQRSRSQEAEVRFGGLAEAPLSTFLGRVVFLVLWYVVIAFVHLYLRLVFFFLLFPLLMTMPLTAEWRLRIESCSCNSSVQEDTRHAWLNTYVTKKLARGSPISAVAVA